MEESSLKVKILTASGDPPVARKCLFHSIPQFDYLKSTVSDNYCYFKLILVFKLLLDI